MEGVAWEGEGVFRQPAGSQRLQGTHGFRAERRRMLVFGGRREAGLPADAFRGCLLGASLAGARFVVRVSLLRWPGPSLLCFQRLVAAWLACR